MATRTQRSSTTQPFAESPIGQILLVGLGIVMLLRLASVLRAVSGVVLAILGVFNALFGVLLSILALLKEAFPLPMFVGLGVALGYLYNKDRNERLNG
ncbi:MAG TPA: hypothetical protein PKD09_18500 [Aggregatilinea sp.]|jgi:hypothetical protein|uniref:hypothetical protein n=1 Tax=Aggregatilinea sp. TaxID=2806333 RepID=UPI002C950D43|nr:hypothetical protein [Aggregatilinea sp.]HML23653.1 hypothetical protein [Aggregatilinea sp.]